MAETVERTGGLRRRMWWLMELDLSFGEKESGGHGGGKGRRERNASAMV